MDRAALATFIATDLDALLAEAEIAATDTPDGLASILDTVEHITAGNASVGEAWHRPLARYVALERIVTRLAAQMDTTIGGDSYRLSQLFTQAKALRDEARALVGWIIEPAQPGSGGTSGGPVVIDMPYLAGGESW